MTDGKATQPCRHIIDLFVDRKGNPVKKIGGFRDICREYRKGSWYAETKVVFPSKGTEGFESSDESDKGFSKSKYNAFSDCPIKYLYDGILKSEDNEYTVFGNCLHDFAEMYFCYPEVVKKKGAVLAYFSLANDKISKTEFENNTEFNRFKRRFKNSKRLKSYPAVKICRLAVDKNARKLHLGTKLLNFIKGYFAKDNKTGCRFITVDAYIEAIPFYLKNSFLELTKNDKDATHTRLLYNTSVRDNELYLKAL